MQTPTSEEHFTTAAAATEAHVKRHPKEHLTRISIFNRGEWHGLAGGSDILDELVV
jgi:hypothetical protein